MANLLGQKIHLYNLVSVLGEGGMGTVYLAQHEQLGRKVAIKALNPSLLKHEQIRQRFKNEAAMLADLQHPNIVMLYDYFENEHGQFLIMEYVDGLPLDEHLKKVSGPIPEDKAVEIFAQVLDAFNYAHEQGIIHRDIKPSNIIISKSGKPKVLDFGIAKVLGDESMTLTKTGARIGTALYMSPEQVKGEQVTAQSDIYSLGVTLFQMLTAQLPYKPETESEFNINLKIVNEPLPRAKEYYPGVSDKIQAVIDKATEKVLQNRHQTCDDFKHALQNLNQVEVKKQTKQSKPKPQANPAQQNTNSPQDAAENKSKLPIKPIGIGGGILVLVLVVAYFFGAFGGKEKEKKDLTPKQIVKKQIKTYHQAMVDKDADGVMATLADKLESIYGTENPSRELVRENLVAGFDNIPFEKVKVSWDSFEFKTMDDGRYEADFDIEYQYKKKADEDWETLYKHRTFKFTKAYKIYYIKQE